MNRLKYEGEKGMNRDSERFVVRKVTFYKMDGEVHELSKW